MTRITVSMLLLIVLALSIPAAACLWDLDTLAVERSRFPTALELITGKFLRHSPAYYRWRVENRTERLVDEPDNLALYDDLAVAYEKLGEHEKAIETTLKKDKLKPGLYETHANRGTFYIHAGRLAEGLEQIERAIEINPDAHFGREVYQKLLVKYVLEKREQGGGKLPLPLDTSGRYESPVGFATHVMVARFGEDWHEETLETRQPEFEKAIKGVLGMMRFGNFDSPVLLEAAGDLLLSRGYPEDAKRLATRAYLRASYEASDPQARDAYQTIARQSVGGQSVGIGNTDQLPFESLEATFKQEVDEAESWYQSLQADEQRWIDEGRDLDLEFASKYLEEPLVEASLVRQVSSPLNNPVFPPASAGQPTRHCGRQIGIGAR